MKIGVFDSGLGGLTIVRAMMRELHNVDIYYLADTLNAPYGEKSKEEILTLSIAITDYFIQHHTIDALVIACNTATSAAIKELRDKYPRLIIVGTEPGLKPAFLQTTSKKVGILATPATLGGEKYHSLINELSQQYHVEVYESACHGLVQQIEKGEISTPKTLSMLEKWLSPMREAHVDTIVLGCTHYPLVENAIEKIMEHPVLLIQTADAVSKRVLYLLKEIGHTNIGPTHLHLAATGSIEVAMIERILGEKFSVNAINLANKEVL